MRDPVEFKYSIDLKLRDLPTIYDSEIALSARAKCERECSCRICHGQHDSQVRGYR
jgi:hypothetical protein